MCVCVCSLSQVSFAAGFPLAPSRASEGGAARGFSCPLKGSPVCVSPSSGFLGGFCRHGGGVGSFPSRLCFLGRAFPLFRFISCRARLQRLNSGGGYHRVYLPLTPYCSPLTVPDFGCPRCSLEWRGKDVFELRLSCGRLAGPEVCFCLRRLWNSTYQSRRVCVRACVRARTLSC